MSLFLLLLALQGADVDADPPLKTESVAPKAVKAPAAKANPKITYVPAKPGTGSTDNGSEAGASPLAGISEAARARLAEERQADSVRRGDLRRDMQSVQDAIAQALAADPLDLEALKAALDRRDQVMAKARSNVTLAVIDLLGDIPVEDRLTVAKALIDRESASQRPAEQKPKPAPDGR